MPVHDKSSEHWYLLAMFKCTDSTKSDASSRVVWFLDSLGPSQSQERMHECTFASWLKYLNACGNNAPVEKRRVQVPKQTNAVDCGVYVLAFAQEIAKNAKTSALDDGSFNWHFDMTEFRKTIATTIVNNPAAITKTNGNDDDAFVVDAKSTIPPFNCALSPWQSTCTQPAKKSRGLDGSSTSLANSSPPTPYTGGSDTSEYQSEPSAYFTTVLRTSDSVQEASYSNTSTLNQPRRDTAQASAFTGSVNDKNTPSVDGWAPVFKRHNFMPVVDESCHPINMEDISIIHKDGFLHWEDDYAALGAAQLEETNLWTKAGINILRAILTNRRLQNILNLWFGKNGPHTILHCFWWSNGATEGQPIFFQQHGYQVQQYLGVHILPKTTLVEYFSGSHTKEWPVTDMLENLGLWFKNSEESLQGYSTSSPVSNGL
ncbi:hypothetical protein ACKVWC_011495 [Pyricularia oryzae]